MSERIACVTDSTAGLKALDPAADWNVVPLELEIDGRRYREGPDFSSASFHRLQQEANTPPKTQPPPPELFADTYRSLLECHDRVFSVHLSAGLSRTVENARAAAAGIEGGGRVTVIDSRMAGAALGLLCLEIEARVLAGVDVETVRADIDRLIDATRIRFSVYTLDFLYLGGRLPRMKAGGASSQEDRPILTLEHGELSLVERVIGETTRVQRIIEMIEHEFGTDEPLVAVTVQAGERGEAAAAAVDEILGSGRLQVVRRATVPLDPVLCAHTGFDVCGVGVYPARLSALTAPNVVQR